MTGVKTFNWGIPAFRSRSGFNTCPKAGICAKGCYAKQGAYVWSNVSQAFEKRLEFSFSANFVSILDSEIKRRKIARLRVHDSGDFYDLKYLNKWLTLAHWNKNTIFYAYTKQVGMIKALMRQGHWPKNFKIIFSLGGKEDHLIDLKNDRHSAVFPDRVSLLRAGYTDASEDDSKALGGCRKIGLVYHGARSKAWDKSA